MSKRSREIEESKNSKNSKKLRKINSVTKNTLPTLCSLTENIKCRNESDFKKTTTWEEFNNYRTSRDSVINRAKNFQRNGLTLNFVDFIQPFDEIETKYIPQYLIKTWYIIKTLYKNKPALDLFKTYLNNRKFEYFDAAQKLLGFSISILDLEYFM